MTPPARGPSLPLVQVAGKKLAVLISAPPRSANFDRAVRLTQAALEAGVAVYVYCLDEAVAGVDDARLQALRSRGLRLFACAYGAQRRRLPVDDRAVFSGLSTLSDLIADTDRLVAFN